jgi:hypothetical protein
MESPKPCQKGEKWLDASGYGTEESSQLDLPNISDKHGRRKSHSLSKNVDTTENQTPIKTCALLSTQLIV